MHETSTVSEHPRIALFAKLQAAGRIDLDSGAWDRSTNSRRVYCGRCAQSIPKERGRPYNVFMTDGYRATTRYLCNSCVSEIVP